MTPEQASAPHGSPPAASADRGLQVLMVEDDGLAADMLRFILEREGYVVTHAADGRLARQAIEQSAPPALRGKGENRAKPKSSSLSSEPAW